LCGKTHTSQILHLRLRYVPLRQSSPRNHVYAPGR
jgi:hypothetical protein